MSSWNRSKSVRKRMVFVWRVFPWEFPWPQVDSDPPGAWLTDLSRRGPACTFYQKPGAQN